MPHRLQTRSCARAVKTGQDQTAQPACVSASGAATVAAPLCDAARRAAWCAAWLAWPLRPWAGWMHACGGPVARAGTDVDCTRSCMS